MDYAFHIVFMIGIYVTLAVSLDLVIGQTGLLSVAHAAFFGVGAYSSALFSTQLGAPAAVGMFCGMVLAVLVSLAVSLPTLRVRDDYFAIATFGWQVIFFTTVNNWTGLTRGPLGIAGIPLPEFAEAFRRPHQALAVGSLIWAAMAIALVHRISGSPFGRVLRAIREDEAFAVGLGKNPLYFKVAAVAASAAIASSAGSWYAHYVTYVDPSGFTVMESISIVAMVVIGGAGTRSGPVIGAVVLVVLPELLRVAGMSSVGAANIRQIVYGAALILAMIVRPQGLLGRNAAGR